jgi:hypothetical protein
MHHIEVIKKRVKATQGQEHRLEKIQLAEVLDAKILCESPQQGQTILLLHVENRKLYRLSHCSTSLESILYQQL